MSDKCVICKDDVPYTGGDLLVISTEWLRRTRNPDTDIRKREYRLGLCRNCAEDIQSEIELLCTSKAELEAQKAAEQPCPVDVQVREITRLRAENERLRAEVERLTAELDEELGG